MIIVGSLLSIIGGFMATQNTSSRLAIILAGSGFTLIVVGLFK